MKTEKKKKNQANEIIISFKSIDTYVNEPRVFKNDLHRLSYARAQNHNKLYNFINVLAENIWPS